MMLRVKKFEELQHYKDRRPVWIKLYNAVLDDYSFGAMPDDAKWHLVAIWLLASRTDNAIPDDARWIARMVGAHGDVDIERFVSLGFIERYDPASGVLADCSVPAIPEKRREEKNREEKSSSASPLAGEFSNPDHAAAYELVRAKSRSVVSFDAGLRAIASGMHGPAYAWATIGQALVEMDAAGANVTAEAVRAFCRRLAALPKGTPAQSIEPLEYGVF